METESQKKKTEKAEILIQEIKNQPSSVIQFGLIVKDSQGTIIRNLNEINFEGEITKAEEIASWYESESKKSKSDFYRCSVERTGYLKEIDDSLNFIQDFESIP